MQLSVTQWRLLGGAQSLAAELPSHRRSFSIAPHVTVGNMRRNSLRFGLRVDIDAVLRSSGAPGARALCDMMFPPSSRAIHPRRRSDTHIEATIDPRRCGRGTAVLLICWLCFLSLNQKCWIFGYAISRMFSISRAYVGYGMICPCDVLCTHAFLHWRCAYCCFVCISCVVEEFGAFSIVVEVGAGRTKYHTDQSRDLQLVNCSRSAEPHDAATDCRSDHKTST